MRLFISYRFADIESLVTVRTVSSTHANFFGFVEAVAGPSNCEFSTGLEELFAPDVELGVCRLSSDNFFIEDFSLNWTISIRVSASDFSH
jgi:hypothetical protein